MRGARTPQPHPVPTADLHDEQGEDLGICATPFRRIGGRHLYAGPVRTVRCHEDNALLRELLHTPGGGAVLVVDGGGSPRTALVGDLVGGAAHRSGGAGLIVHGIGGVTFRAGDTVYVDDDGVVVLPAGH
ncbi:S-adenosylmethionine--2-demethylmenaquinone methyltransferase [Streptomyces sp. NPDC012794]|uniref:RraA family protein n=1 Tax=Streptomyces sp. NPDC012794 TaxID=3364850 RepID=UPI0036A69C00